MPQDKYITLLDLIDEKIRTLEPRRDEYFRGYRRGIQSYFLGNLEERVEEHFSLYAAAERSTGDAYVEKAVGLLELSR